MLLLRTDASGWIQCARTHWYFPLRFFAIVRVFVYGFFVWYIFSSIKRYLFRLFYLCFSYFHRSEHEQIVLELERPCITIIIICFLPLSVSLSLPLASVVMLWNGVPHKSHLRITLSIAWYGTRLISSVYARSFVCYYLLFVFLFNFEIKSCFIINYPRTEWILFFDVFYCMFIELDFVFLYSPGFLMIR